MGKIKKILENELVGGTQNTDVYPVTSIKAVYDEDNERLDNIINRRGIVNISTSYNGDHIAEILTLQQAITKVPSKDRVLGFQGKFLNDTNWVTYQFNGKDVSEWLDINKWSRILNSTDAHLLDSINSTRPFGKNLFDKNNLAFNGARYYISHTDGSIIKNDNYSLYVSNLIPIKSGNTYLTISASALFNSSTGWRFLDESGNIIGYGAFENSNKISIVIPSGAQYFQFSTTNKDNVQVEYGTAATEYEEFVSSDSSEKMAQKYNISGANFGVNRFNRLNLYNPEYNSFGGLNKFINPGTGSNVDDPYYKLCISHPIDIPNTNRPQYINISIIEGKLSSSQGYRFVDSKNNIISYGAYTESASSMSIKIPKKAAYCQFTIKGDYTYQVVFGDTTKPFERYNKIGDSLDYIPINLLSGVKGTKNLFLGKDGSTKYTKDYNMYLFDNIPISPDTLYTIGVFRDVNNNLTGGGYYVIYDANYNELQIGRWDKSNNTGLGYWEFTTPSEAAYIRFSISYGYKKSLFLVKGSLNNISLDDIVGNSTSLSLINNSTHLPITLVDDFKNLYDNSVQFIENRRYISPTSGKIVVQPAYDMFVTYPIPLTKINNRNLTLSTSTTFNSSTGWRFLDLRMRVLSYGRMTNDKKITLDIPLGAAYFQFSCSRSLEQIQVEYGQEATEYSQYRGIASTNYVDNKLKVLSNSGINAYLPDTLFFTKNRRLPLYLSNFVNIPVHEVPNIQIFGTGISTYSKAAICNIQSDANVTIKSYRNLENNTIKTISAKSVNQESNSGKSIKLMCLGDSYTEISYWAQALKDNLIEDSVNVKMIGAMHSVRSGENLGVSTENQTGGTLKDNFMSKVSGKCFVVNVSGVVEKNMPINYTNYVSYNSNGFTWTVWGYDLDDKGNGKMRLYCLNSSATLPQSGTLTKVSGTGDSSINYSGIVEVNKNPFWNLSTNTLDVEGINSYFRIWNFDKPDVLILQFMWNDLSNWAIDSSISSFISYLKTFISLFRDSVGPTLPVIFSIEPSAPINTGQNYDTNGRKYTVLKFAEALYSSFLEDGNTYICPSFAFVDSEHAFGSADVVISNRFPNYKESASTDSVHPIQAGMYQIGDAITPYVHYLLSSM